MHRFLTADRRIRARGGLADEAARALASELEALGAVVVIEPPLDGSVAAAPTSRGTGPVRPATRPESGPVPPAKAGSGPRARVARDSGRAPPAAPRDSGRAPPAAPRDTWRVPPSAPRDTGRVPPAAPRDTGRVPPAAPRDTGRVPLAAPPEGLPVPRVTGHGLASRPVSGAAAPARPAPPASEARPSRGPTTPLPAGPPPPGLVGPRGTAPRVYESGLSNSLRGTPSDDTDALGALGRDGGLTLSSLDGAVVETDGAEEALSRPGRPVDPPAPSSPGDPRRTELRDPPPRVSAALAVTQSASQPPDRFAPPAETAPIEIALAFRGRPSAGQQVAAGSGPHEQALPRAGGDPSVPRFTGQQVAQQPAEPRAPDPAGAEPPAEVTRGPRAARRQATGLRDPRLRLTVALVVGLLAGFAAAHLYASAAEDGLDVIRLELLHEPAAQSGDQYQQALERHEVARARMERTRRRIAVAAGILWLGVGAGAAYGVSRVMPRRS